MISADTMRSLPDYFLDIDDPRAARAAVTPAGRARHRGRHHAVRQARLQAMASGPPTYRQPPASGSATGTAAMTGRLSPSTARRRAMPSTGRSLGPANPTSASPRPRARRVEGRAIRATTRLNGHLNFPHVGKAFLVERTATEKKPGKTSVELVLVSPATPRTAPTPGASSN